MDVVTYALCKKIIKDAIENIGSVFTIKGNVFSYSELPQEENENGDVYLVGPKLDGSYDEYYWSDIGAWESMGSTAPDMSSYITDVTMYKGLDATGTVQNPAPDTILYTVFQLEKKMYSAQENADEVQLSIDGENVISATLVDGSITSDKLSQELKDAIQNASEALEGLGSAAYAETSDFDPKGAADTAEANAKEYTDKSLTWDTF